MSITSFLEQFPAKMHHHLRYSGSFEILVREYMETQGYRYFSCPGREWGGKITNAPIGQFEFAARGASPKWDDELAPYGLRVVRKGFVGLAAHEPMGEGEITETIRNYRATIRVAIRMGRSKCDRNPASHHQFEAERGE